MRKYWIAAVFSFSIILLSSISPAAGESLHTKDTQSTILSNIRYWPAPNYTRIVLDLNNPATYFDKYLPEPDRVYIDIHNTIIAGDVQPFQIGNGIVNQVRVAQHDRQTVRVVLELSSPVEYKIFPLKYPDRLVVDIYQKPSIKETPTLQKSLNSITRTIVIDPGHGGKDPGAKGRHGIMEKDIVLDVGLRLKRLIEDRTGARVVMTRDTDIFIPLEERTAIANSKGADLFISIHANSSRREGARGVETYLLGRATDMDAMDTALRENSVSEKSSLDDLQLILADLLNTAKKDESLRLAHYVQENIIDSLEPRYNTINLGVKQAPFYVLVNAKMPSILAEISFISNPEEERLLTERKYRREIAEAIFEGISRYIQSTPLLAQPKEAINIPAP